MERNGKNTAGIRGKDDERKLFLGGLPKQCTEEDLHNALSQFGKIESVNIKIDAYSLQPRGFCFVVFSEASAVDNVLAAGDIVIAGKKVDPRKVTKVVTPGKVFVGGITQDLTEDKIREFFGQFGKITELQWPFDKVKNQRRPYLFITFETRDTVSELLRTPKQTVGGVELDVKKVKFNPETMWHPSLYARGPRGYAPAYPPPYGFYDYREDYGYEDYTGTEGDPYYDAYGYESYAPYPSYAPRAPRGGRSAGGYVRHAPY